MPFTLTMPKLSPTMEEGSIAKWRKNVGDEVQPGDVLFEVATDKATVEYNALDGGFLRKIVADVGKEVRVGEAVAIFSEDKDEDISSYKVEEVAPPPKVEEKKEETKAPKEEKAAPVVTASMPTFTPEPPLENYEFPFPEGEADKRLKATPYVKKLAKEEGIDLSTIKGSGPGGRIVSEDLELAQKSPFKSRKRPEHIPGSFEEETLSPMRKVIATRLQQSKSSVPHFYVDQEVDIEPVVKLRAQLKEGGVKVTMNDIVVRAVALTLREHPSLNSGFNTASQSIIRFKTIDISIAVSIDDGLITPIVRQADFKNLGQIGAEVQSLAKRAKEGKLNREEYVGGSFTVSNLGMFGVSGFKGIINPPQAAILSVGGIEEKAVVREGKVAPGKTMTFSLSADHRVLDGADVAKFLKSLQNLLENPALLLV